MSQDQHLYVRRASAGSGKTYTLAAHYIALLLHGESYRSILAVTFTNKATAEMKERILTYLYSIARETSLSSTQGFLRRVREIYDELGYHSELLTDDYCRRRAEQLFLQILSDYDGMKVSTIDAFLQTLLAGMVQMLGGAVGYQVELDTDGVISDAVDRLLTERAQDSEVCQRLTNYMKKRMSEDKHWDIRSGLKRIAAELYREELQQKADRLVLREDRLNELREQMKAERKAALDELATVVKQVSDSNKTALKVKTRMLESMAGTVTKKENLFKSFTEKELAKFDVGSPEWRMDEVAAKCRRVWYHTEFITCHLDDLVLMNELRSLIRESLQAANSRLLGETAGTLAQTLKDGDADFILEKVGIRYRHIMLDEFQDTSSLQWENFRHLLEEILSTTEGSTLIVGDIKQSIYRWRNGDWKIMAGLDQEWSGYYNQDIPALKCNFRSEREVVQFNLDTMSALASMENPDTIAPIYYEGYDGTNLSDYYRSGHEGGYVSLRCFRTDARGEKRHATRREVVTLMLEAIGRLHGYGVPYREMMILIRKNKEAAEILQVMKELGYAYPIVSNDCFELGSSPSVQVLIAAMRWIYLRDEVSAEYLRMVRPDLDPTSLLTPACRQFSLSDLTEHLTRLYLCDKQGQCQAKDIAYLMAFKDKVRSYVATVGSDGERFLVYWEEKLSTKAIASTDSDGIRMMTVHSSKGLEAANVFIPFCDWPMEGDRSDSRLWCEVDELTTEDGHQAILPIPMNSQTAEAGFAAEYAEEHRLQRIDSLNLLYVALTRAAERLYVYADATGSDTVAQSLMNLYGESYEHGVEWEAPAPVSDDVTEHEKAEKKPTQPFRFEGADSWPVQVFSSEEHIEFQQSQDSRKYGWNIASVGPDSDTLDQRVWGTICHEVMALLGVYADRETALASVPSVLDEAYQHGLIPVEELKETIRPLLVDVLSDPVAGQWFTGDWQVLREEAVIFRGEHGEIEERRMDRVMWRDREAVVLDYKFGHDDPAYDRQVRHYMSICRRMGAESVRGYLWIAKEKRLVEIPA